MPAPTNIVTSGCELKLPVVTDMGATGVTVIPSVRITVTNKLTGGVSSSASLTSTIILATRALPY